MQFIKYGCVCYTVSNTEPIYSDDLSIKNSDTQILATSDDICFHVRIYVCKHIHFIHYQLEIEQHSSSKVIFSLRDCKIDKTKNYSSVLSEI